MAESNPGKKTGAVLYKKDDTERQDMARLIRLAAADEGLFLLATHAFFEKVMRDRTGLRFRSPTIAEGGIRDDFFFISREYEATQTLDAEALRNLIEIRKCHDMTNFVRHAFGTCDSSIAQAAARHFVVFCRGAKINLGEAEKEFEAIYKDWQNREAVSPYGKKIRALEHSLAESQAGREQIAKANADEVRERESKYESQIRELSEEIGRLKETDARKAQKIDELRKVRNELTQALKEREASKVDDYIALQLQYTMLNRTRRQFEQSVFTLTPEQEKAAEAALSSEVLYVKGAAGTGKSIVLLEALKRDWERSGKNPDSRFITYTKSHEKYLDYLASLRGIENPDSFILRIDPLVAGLLRDYGISKSYDPSSSHLRKLCEEDHPEFLTKEELFTEIEEFIFGNVLSRSEYLTIPREGLKKPLNAAQRAEVWEYRTRFADAMTRNRPSRNYSRILILEQLRHWGAAFERPFKRLLIDEAQDMRVADLRLLRELVTGGIILAGDIEQSLYIPKVQYTRAGFNFQGKARILGTVFRTTSEICAIADKFRSTIPGRDGEVGLRSFRHGTLPEIYTAPSSEVLMPFFKSKLRIFVEDLKYDLENISVIYIGDDYWTRKTLEEMGYPYQRVKDEDFTFEDSSIRLMTAYSSKGLDAPVVLLVIGKYHAYGDYDDQTKDKMLRNLVYVAMTRAMDHLNVFTVESPSPVCKDLVNSFEGN